MRNSLLGALPQSLIAVTVAETNVGVPRRIGWMLGFDFFAAALPLTENVVGHFFLFLHLLLGCFQIVCSTKEGGTPIALGSGWNDK